MTHQTFAHRAVTSLIIIAMFGAILIIAGAAMTIATGENATPQALKTHYTIALVGVIMVLASLLTSVSIIVAVIINLIVHRPRKGTNTNFKTPHG